jgi:hypothetical protein
MFGGMNITSLHYAHEGWVKRNLIGRQTKIPHLHHLPYRRVLGELDSFFVGEAGADFERVNPNLRCGS